MPDLEAIRRRYAAEIQAAGHIRSEAIVQALANVPRERFLGPGPWQVLQPGATDEYRSTADADPAWLYHDLLVAIDPARGLNNGQPSYLAFCLDSLDLRPGDGALHVGCGVGYYTAMMAEVVGAAGRVTGIEIDAALATRARENLAGYEQVEVVHGDGGEYAAGGFDAIFVNAGATHLRPAWLDPLRPGGRLVIFLTLTVDDSAAGRGGTLKITRTDGGYEARFLAPVSVFHCIGSRDGAANLRLLRAMMGGSWDSVRSLRRDRHDRVDSCWLHAGDHCLSRLPVP